MTYFTHFEVRFSFFECFCTLQTANLTSMCVTLNTTSNVRWRSMIPSVNFTETNTKPLSIWNRMCLSPRRWCPVLWYPKQWLFSWNRWWNWLSVWCKGRSNAFVVSNLKEEGAEPQSLTHFLTQFFVLTFTCDHQSRRVAERIRS